MRGGRVILFFGAVWCGISYETLSWIQASKPSGVTVIAVSIDEDLDLLKSFLAKEDPTITVIFDGNKFTGRLAKMFNISSIPTAYLIDESGIIVTKTYGVDSTFDAIRVFQPGGNS